MIVFLKDEYQVEYAENSRETIRKHAMHKFRDAAVIEDNGKATNSPNYRYRLTDEIIVLLHAFGSEEWQDKLSLFKEQHTTLIELYSSKRELKKTPVVINGKEFSLSTGEHNQLQKAIIEEFAPRFAGEKWECLYLGDSTNRDLIKNDSMLMNLGFGITQHDIMPDVVLYRADKNWLYFIEAVTSVGPMSQERVNNIEKMTEEVQCGKIYITAFPSRNVFKRFLSELAWETEVWIADEPNHMIHLNGNKFMGPYKKENA